MMMTPCYRHSSSQGKQVGLRRGWQVPHGNTQYPFSTPFNWHKVKPEDRQSCRQPGVQALPGLQSQPQGRVLEGEAQTERTVCRPGPGLPRKGGVQHRGAAKADQVSVLLASVCPISSC